MSKQRPEPEEPPMMRVGLSHALFERFRKFAVNGVVAGAVVSADGRSVFFDIDVLLYHELVKRSGVRGFATIMARLLPEWERQAEEKSPS